MRRDKNQNYVAQSFNFFNGYFHLEIVYNLSFIIYKYCEFQIRFEDMNAFIVTIKIISLKKKSTLKNAKLSIYNRKNALFVHFRYE